MPHPDNLTRKFGDLYLSLADFCSYEPDVRKLNLEHMLYIELLFRKNIYIEESVFFLKNSFVADLASAERGHVVQAIRQGIIQPLTKGNSEKDAPKTFEEMALRYPHYVRKDKKPETLKDKMHIIGRDFDKKFTTLGDKIKIKSMDAEGFKDYNVKLEEILQLKKPPINEELNNYDEYLKMWNLTEEYRFEWVADVLNMSNSMGYASAPKTAFNQKAADRMRVEYKDLGALIAYWNSHEQAPELVTFLRWVHEIFYFSRADCLEAATAYAQSNKHLNLPYLYAVREMPHSKVEDYIFTHKVQLPTFEALKRMDSMSFLDFRDSLPAKRFFVAINDWQRFGSDSSARELRESIDEYARKICEAQVSEQSSTEEHMVTLQSCSLKAFGATSTIMPNGLQIAASVNEAAKFVKDGVESSFSEYGALGAVVTLLSVAPSTSHGPKELEEKELQFGLEQTVISC